MEELKQIAERGEMVRSAEVLSYE